MILQPYLSTSPFVGREKELADIEVLFSNPACRLLTLVGPGGIGKTRLAIEASHRMSFSDGVYFIPLQPLSSPDFIVSTIADLLSIQFHAGADPCQQLLAYLSDKSLLLVLDNVEHLLDGMMLVSDMLVAAPGIRILATSRERLNLREEWALEVSGLNVPATETETNIEGYSAVELFVQHARRANVNFALNNGHKSPVVRICRLVGGMPLGIELAAAWVRVLSCEQIADEIERSLDILETPVRNVEPRHRTLRAAFEPTWNRLSGEERGVFKKLPVFHGGFTREAAENVAGASLRTLTTLVDKSLLRVNEHGRYELQELLRQYGEEQLQESTEEWIQANELHCDYYAAFLKRRVPDLKTDKHKEARRDLEVELDNVRAAWDWAIRSLKLTKIGMLLESYDLFNNSNRNHEQEQVFARAAAALRPNASDPAIRHLLGRVLAQQGATCYALDRFEDAELLLRESIELLSECDTRSDRVFALFWLGATLTVSNNPEAETLLQSSLTLYREIGELHGVASTLTWLAIAGRCLRIRDLEQTLQLRRESLAVYTQVGSKSGIAASNLGLACIAAEMADYQGAWQFARNGLAAFKELEVVWGMAQGYRVCAWAALGLGEYAEARLNAYHALALAVEHRMMRGILDALGLVACIMMATGETERAFEFLGLVDEHRKKMGIGSIFDDVSQPLPKIVTEPPSEAYATAFQCGKDFDLEATVKEVLLELEGHDHEMRIRAITSSSSPLTERELEIMCLVADGFSNREIADQLVLAVSTVKWYLNEIFSKLHVSNRTEAVACVRALGVLS